MDVQQLQQPQEAKYAMPLALVSFGIGTLLFVLFQCNPDSFDLLAYGLLFVILAAFANLLMLVNLLFLLFIYPEQREAIAIKILLLLSNIPIACFYFSFVAKTAASTVPLNF